MRKITLSDGRQGYEYYSETNPEDTYLTGAIVANQELTEAAWDTVEKVIEIAIKQWWELPIGTMHDDMQYYFKRMLEPYGMVHYIPSEAVIDEDGNFIDDVGDVWFEHESYREAY